MAESNKEKKAHQKKNQNILNDNIDDSELGNQMEDDILTFDEDALKNPNPTKNGKEENERPGGGLRK